MLALSERRAEVVGELGMGWLFAGEPPPAPPAPGFLVRSRTGARLPDVQTLSQSASLECGRLGQRPLRTLL